MNLTIEERQTLKNYIQQHQIPEEGWALLERLFEENENNRKRASDLAWQLENMQENQLRPKFKYPD